MLFIPFLLMAQNKITLQAGTSYADDQVDTLIVTQCYYDTLQVLFEFNDSVDVDVSYDFSNGGVNWSNSGKLMDIVFTAAADTSYEFSSPEPHFYGRYILTFASSANGTTSATYKAWIKQFKTHERPNY